MTRGERNFLASLLLWVLGWEYTTAYYWMFRAVAHDDSGGFQAFTLGCVWPFYWVYRSMLLLVTWLWT